MLTRIISTCLIFFITATVVQSAFCGIDSNFEKKFELTKKNCEDNSEEESADDLIEDEYEEALTQFVPYYQKNTKGKKAYQSHTLNYRCVNYRSITTPPPEFEFYS